MLALCSSPSKTHPTLLFLSGQQVIEEQRRRLAELKQRAAAEAQCQWEALHGSQPHILTPSSTSYSPVMASSPALSHSSSGPPTLVHHSILHHHPPPGGEPPYDTLSLESSDSMDTSVSTGNNSACSPDNMSGWVRRRKPSRLGVRNPFKTSIRLFLAFFQGNV